MDDTVDILHNWTKPDRSMVCAYIPTLHGKLYWNACDRSTIRYNDTVSQNTLIIPPSIRVFALNVPDIVNPLRLPSMTASGLSLGHITFLLAFLISTALRHACRHDIPELCGEQLYPP